MSLVNQGKISIFPGDLRLFPGPGPFFPGGPGPVSGDADGGPPRVGRSLGQVEDRPRSTARKMHQWKIMGHRWLRYGYD